MRWVIVLLVVGCGSHGAAPPTDDRAKLVGIAADQATCVDIGRTLRGSVNAVDASRFKQKTITQTCRTERWTPAAISCIAREQQVYVCRHLLTEAQRDSYTKQLCAYQKRFPEEGADVESCDVPVIVRKAGSLYDRLGGKDTISSIVNEWIALATTDTRINAMFANVSISGLKLNLVEQLCQATGGPCTYTGKDMQSAHAGMGITSAQFAAFIEDLGKALDKVKIGAPEKAELVTMLTALKSEVVTAP